MALVFAVACVGVAAMLVPSGQPSLAETQPRVEPSAVEAQAKAPAVAQPAPKPRTPRPETRKPAAAPVAASAARAVATPAPNVERTDSSANPVAAAAATSGSAPASAPPPVAQGEAATITGCLEFDDEKFRLKDTEGEAAPKSRSWRSGFLRRNNARIDLVDAPDRLRLATHVGHRISVTGMLVEREMQARSVKMVADSCDD